jgi:hypothetical protein
MPRLRNLAALVLVVTLLFGACGGAKTPGPGDQPSASASAEPSESAAALPAKLDPASVPHPCDLATQEELATAIGIGVGALERDDSEGLRSCSAQLEDGGTFGMGIDEANYTETKFRSAVDESHGFQGFQDVSELKTIDGLGDVALWFSYTSSSGGPPRSKVALFILQSQVRLDMDISSPPEGDAPAGGIDALRAIAEKALSRFQ